MGYILAASLNNWEDKLASDQENQVISGVNILSWKILNFCLIINTMIEIILFRLLQ